MEQTVTQAPGSLDTKYEYIILNMDILNYLLSEYGANCYPGSWLPRYEYIILNMDLLNYLLSEYGANCYLQASLILKY